MWEGKRWKLLSLPPPANGSAQCVPGVRKLFNQRCSVQAGNGFGISIGPVTSGVKFRWQTGRPLPMGSSIREREPPTYAGPRCVKRFCEDLRAESNGTPRIPFSGAASQSDSMQSAKCRWGFTPSGMLLCLLEEAQYRHRSRLTFIGRGSFMMSPGNWSARNRSYGFKARVSDYRNYYGVIRDTP